MAHIIPFSIGKKKPDGVIIGMLPMPDGTCRAYKEYGRDALKTILNRWQAEREKMMQELKEAANV